jgi:hypothetical protein
MVLVSWSESPSVSKRLHADFIPDSEPIPASSSPRDSRHRLKSVERWAAPAVGGQLNETESVRSRQPRSLAPLPKRCWPGQPRGELRKLLRSSGIPSLMGDDLQKVNDGITALNAVQGIKSISAIVNGDRGRIHVQPDLRTAPCDGGHEQARRDRGATRVPAARADCTRLLTLRPECRVRRLRFTLRLP